MLEEQPHEDLLLGRFRKIKLIQKTQKYKKYLIKDAYDGQVVWIKVQNIQAPKPTVLHQAGYLQQFQGYPGFPLMIWSGSFTEQQIGLFTEKLGYNLQQLMMATENKHFSLETVCLIGLQIIKILQIMHDKHTLLEQFRPQLFRTKSTELDKLVLQNMMHCKRYRSTKTLQIYSQRRVENLQFFNQFLSYSKISMYSTSRRDDLESLLYLLVYLRKGYLPWSKLISGNIAESRQRLLQMHRNLSLDPANKILQELLSDLPRQFYQIFENIFTLKFEQRPNYSFIRLKLKKIISRMSKLNQPILDWIKYVPSLRKQSLKPGQIILKNRHDLYIQQLCYLPFQRKIQLDCLPRSENNINLSNDHQYQARQFKSNLQLKRNKCQLM